MFLFDGLSERGKLLIALLLICFTAILTAYLLEGLSASVIILGFCCFVVWISRSLWSSENKGRLRLAWLSILIITSATVGLPWWQEVVRGVVKNLLAKYFAGEGVKIAAEVSPYFALLILAGVIVLLNYFFRDKTGMVIHSTPIDEEFPELNYRKSLKRYCRVIRKTIEDIDLETNWSFEDFTPLDAEVEIRTTTRSTKKITDLLNAIKRNHETDCFLVLGDPGSGKSVALRKLCLDLLVEVDRTGKIPVYVNLKEWKVKEKWSVDNPPTAQ